MCGLPFPTNNSYLPWVTDVALGQWYHVVGVKQGATMYLYVNGELRGSQAYSGTIDAYDALNRRKVKAVSNGGLTGALPNGSWTYLYDGARIVEEVGDNPTVQYVWGQYVDELIQLNVTLTLGPQPLPAGSYYLLSDLLYRSVALTNSTGVVVEAYDTDAYGNTLLFKGPGTDGLWFSNDDVQADYSACRYVFTGREYDAETRLACLRSRYYQSALGRFVSRDPLGYVDDANLYQYVAGSPVMSVDPFGFQGTQPATQPADLVRSTVDQTDTTIASEDNATILKRGFVDTVITDDGCCKYKMRDLLRREVHRVIGREHDYFESDNPQKRALQDQLNALNQSMANTMVQSAKAHRAADTLFALGFVYAGISAAGFATVLGAEVGMVAAVLAVASEAAALAMTVAADNLDLQVAQQTQQANALGQSLQDAPDKIKSETLGRPFKIRDYNQAVLIPQIVGVKCRDGTQWGDVKGL
jgi:RHS repeat-associated protein